jgi:hypothetical protein
VRGGQVTGRHPQPRQLGQGAWQQAALERLGDLSLDHEPGSLDGERDTVGDQQEELDVALPELPRGEGADVQDPDHVALDHQGHPQQGSHPLFPEQRIDHLIGRALEIFDHHRLPRKGDPPGEAVANRQAEPPLDLLLEPFRGSGSERAPVFLDQQHGRGIRLENAGDPVEQLGEQVVEVEVGERGLGDPLDVLESDDGLLRGHRLRGGLLVVARIRRHGSPDRFLGSQVAREGGGDDRVPARLGPRRYPQPHELLLG